MTGPQSPCLHAPHSSANDVWHHWSVTVRDRASVDVLNWRWECIDFIIFSSLFSPEAPFLHRRHLSAEGKFACLVGMEKKSKNGFALPKIGFNGKRAFKAAITLALTVAYGKVHWFAWSCNIRLHRGQSLNFSMHPCFSVGVIQVPIAELLAGSWPIRYSDSAVKTWP